MKQFKQSDIEIAFEVKVLPRTVQEGNCLFFTGGKASAGYGELLIKGKLVTTHRLAYAYYHNINDFQGLFVLHSCDNPSCIAEDHLRLGNHKENMQDRVDRDRTNRKLVDDEIRQVYTSTETTTELAKRFNITKSTINAIRCRKEWAEVTKDLSLNIPIGKDRARDSHSNLTKEAIRAIYLSTLTHYALVSKFAVSSSAISSIKTKRSWSDITKNLGDAGHYRKTKTKQSLPS